MLYKADIRKFANHLLQLDTYDESILVPADSHDIKLFEARKHEGPIAVKSSFQLDLDGTYTSAWNKRAAVVFRD